MKIIRYIGAPIRSLVGELRYATKVAVLLVASGLIVAVMGYWLLISAVPWEDDPIRQYWPTFFQFFGLAISTLGVAVGAIFHVRDRLEWEAGGRG